MNFSKYTYIIRGPCLLRSISTCQAFHAKNHYDVLEISPKTNQVGIKEAYYKLSKIYHPDINDDPSAAVTFRAITEAYEVLGNPRLKRLYDRGVITDVKHPPEEPEEETAEMRFHRKHANRSKVPTSGHTRDYNFDEWTRQHYGETYQRQQSHKLREETKRKKEIIQGNDTIGQGGGIFAMFLVVLIAAMLSSANDGPYSPSKRKE